MTIGEPTERSGDSAAILGNRLKGSSFPPTCFFSSSRSPLSGNPAHKMARLSCHRLRCGSRCAWQCVFQTAWSPQAHTERLGKRRTSLVYSTIFRSGNIACDVRRRRAYPRPRIFAACSDTGRDGLSPCGKTTWRVSQSIRILSSNAPVLCPRGSNWRIGRSGHYSACSCEELVGISLHH